jgi:hypothetical protein
MTPAGRFWLDAAQDPRQRCDEGKPSTAAGPPAWSGALAGLLLAALVLWAVTTL